MPRPPTSGLGSAVAAGLEGDVGGGSLDGEAARGGLFEGYDLGVVVVVVEVCACTEDLAVANDHATDLRIGAGERDGSGGKMKCVPHEIRVALFQFEGCHL